MKEIAIIPYIMLLAVMYATSLAVYHKFNKGLARNAKGLQRRRYLIASSIAILPVAVAQVPVLSASVLLNLAIALFCGASYPIIYHLSNHRQSPDYDNRIDLVFGIYLFGWLTALQTVSGALPYPFSATAGALTGFSALVPVALATIQWIHYLIYGSNFDMNGMQATLDTDRNEIIEFIKSFPLHITLAIAFAVVALPLLCIGAEIAVVTDYGTHITGVIVAAVWIAGLCAYMWIGKRSLLCRTGFVALYLDMKEYGQRTRLYVEEMDNRLKGLELKFPKPQSDKPHTYIMIIGESASRDYMSVYYDMEHDSTPWLKKCDRENANDIVFTNVYSCHHQTVPTLEQVLTERNQYNGKQFYESVSIIDIARKAGYTTHWYSNQGCIGVADTSVTLVANTCDTAKWTKQEVNKLQYDGSLIEFLDEVDPAKNNFVVLHLMGSHFNYINRYPKEHTQWGEPGVQDNMLNYLNSLHYTDSLLKKVYEYGCEKLNLQAMLYFSDHAAVPDKRRPPHFNGFDMVRIPMSIHCTDSYIKEHKERFEALKAHKETFFTNDLVYELVCGLLDIESNHFDTSNSLAHKEYKYTREMLYTCGGEFAIIHDTAVKTE